MSVANWSINTFEPQLSWTLNKVRTIETYLGPRDDWVEDDRRYFYEWANKFLAPLGRPTIQEAPAEGHIRTVGATPDEVETLLHPKYERNLLSTRKYREFRRSGKQWAVGSWVYDPPQKGWQHHVYLFRSPEGGTEIYGHKEPSVRDPDAHVDPETGVYGDPDNILGDLLDNA